MYNGEHVARLGRLFYGQIVCGGENHPVRLGIGDSQAYYESSFLDAGPEPYLKVVVFIDIYTDRGDFRFRPPFTFDPETPVFDENAAKASDIEMAERSAAVNREIQEYNDAFINSLRVNPADGTGIGTGPGAHRSR